MKEKNAPKVLIVDDLATNIDLLQAYLEEEGYNILKASNGKQGWELALKELPDIILLDVMMPIMDGYEACKLIKNNKLTNNIPVVMVTSLNEVSSRIAGIEAGADDFLSKPFNIYELLARVKSLLRIRQYNSQILDQNRIFQKELEIAKRVQEAIIPENNPDLEGLILHYQYIPCQTLGGDYFNYIELSEGRVAIFLSDVM
ncbi:MAG: response regulator, partial [Spirochaetota bacterium]|nr:response regulator [Spirochaetota bacterium]